MPPMLAPALAAVLLCAQAPSAPAAAPAWEALEPGLEFALLDGPPGSEEGDGKIAAVRIDPTRFDLRLANASAPGQGAPLTAREWAYRTGGAPRTSGSNASTALSFETRPWFTCARVRMSETLVR